MITQQTNIDYSPHSRPKRYYIVQRQFNSAVQPSTYTDNYSFREYYRRYPKLSVATILLWIGLIACALVGAGYLMFGR